MCTHRDENYAVDAEMQAEHEEFMREKEARLARMEEWMKKPSPFTKVKFYHFDEIIVTHAADLG